MDSYSYDPAGNRLTVQIITNPGQTGPIGVDGTYTYNDQNELMSYTDATCYTSYVYDADGNRTESDSSPNQTGYFYDTSDRLIEVTGIEGANEFSAAYDAAGNRVAKRDGDAAVGQPNAAVLTMYLYDNGTNFQEYDKNDAVTEELVRAGGQGGGIGSILYTDQTMAPTAGPVEYFTYNAIGDTVATTDASGQTTQTTLYDAFGKVVSQTGTSNNNRLRNTKERDASTGLDDDGRRYYDSTNGVYINRDPSGYGDGLNVYLSDHDDPINGVDPLGLAAITNFTKAGRNHFYPLYLGGSADQPVGWLTTPQHRQFHQYFEDNNLGYLANNGDAARSAWGSLEPLDRVNHIVNASANAELSGAQMNTIIDNMANIMNNDKAGEVTSRDYGSNMWKRPEATKGINPEGVMSGKIKATGFTTLEGLGTTMLVAGAALDTMTVLNSPTPLQTAVEKGGAWEGSLALGEAGAAIGSAAGPLGTAVGGAGGGIVGYVSGSSVAKDAYTISTNWSAVRSSLRPQAGSPASYVPQIQHDMFSTPDDSNAAGDQQDAPAPQSNRPTNTPRYVSDPPE